MLYFEMLVENSTLLNILLPNDNKVLKEALKEADSKSLEQIIKNNTGSVGDVLKDLFENLKSGTKTNTSIENILKNSTVFKEIGNFSNSLSSMLENLTSEEKSPILEKFKPILENFLKNIKDLDANTLKTQLQNSGVFLESKMAQNSNSKIENILNQIQNLIKDLDTPKTKQINELISKLIQNPDNSNKNDLSTNLKTLANALENLNNSMTSSQNIDIKNGDNSNNLNLQNQIIKFIGKIENILKELINPTLQRNEHSNLNEDMKAVLLKIQEELNSSTDQKSQELNKQIDKLLAQIDYQQLLSLTTNSNSVYVPFLWDMLEDGNISMKKADEEKFYCQINLTLKDFGKVDLMLALYDKNKLDLTVYAQREHFKTAIRENMQKLKIALNNVDLIPVNIKLLDLKEEEKDTPTQTYLNNSYNQSLNLTSGIDIRA